MIGLVHIPTGSQSRLYRSGLAPTGGIYQAARMSFSTQTAGNGTVPPGVVTASFSNYPGF
jgi:hypothetical protein